MTIYIDLQGSLEMEMKQVSQSGVEAKSESKAAPQPPYTKEFKDKVIEVYNSGIYKFGIYQGLMPVLENVISKYKITFV